MHLLPADDLSSAIGGRRPALDPAALAYVNRYEAGPRRDQAAAAQLLAAGHGGSIRDRRFTSISHDGGSVAVLQSAEACGLDVEDRPSQLFADVATRFATGPERHGLDAARLRALWTAKECVAKALGLGLRADLRSIGPGADALRRWVPVTWRGARTEFQVRTFVAADRAVSLCVRQGAAPVIEVMVWRVATAGPTWRVVPAVGRPAPIASTVAALMSTADPLGLAG